MQAVHIKTPRVFMRDLIESDAEFIFELDSNPEVQKYVGNAPLTSLDQAREVIKSIRQQYADNGIGRWAVIDNNSGAFMGWAGLKLIKEPLNGFVNHYDVGYRLMQKYWKQGFGSECAKAAVDFGFNNLNQKELHAYVHSGNIASKKILSKTGMKYFNSFFDDGDLCDWYSIKKE